MSDPQTETRRQYRVLRQSLSMHLALKDKYTFFALVLDIALILGALILCGATFVADDMLLTIGVKPSVTKALLGAASLFVLFLSLVGLRAGWKEKAGRHKKTGDELTRVIAQFREERQQDDTWPQNKTRELSRSYWGSMDFEEPIPTRQFNRLKARHLTKVEISKALDKNPGCPFMVVYFKVVLSGLKRALGKRR